MLLIKKGTSHQQVLAWVQFQELGPQNLSRRFTIPITNSGKYCVDLFSRGNT